VQAVREAYQPLSRSGEPLAFPETPEEFSGQCAKARTAVAMALSMALTESEREEIQLVAAKIDLREGEAGNPEALQQAREKLQTFLGTVRTPARASEARGWLARVYYLLGEDAAAAKIYLDELSVADSALPRGTLLQSLHMLFASDESRSRLADHLEEYFATPKLALFVVNLLTNPSYQQGRPALAAVARKAITALQQHPELFRAGGESAALALALMRAALYMGDPKAALTYARMVPRTSTTTQSPEFNWMTAACHFLRREYAAAEAPLLRMYHSAQANDRDRSAAAQALIGVYQKLGRGADQLHAAFLYYQAGPPYPGDYLAEGRTISWPHTGWLLDLPYLLDIQLTDKELRAYLRRYGRTNGPRFRTWTSPTTGQPRYRSAAEMVEYVLTVRHARREEYDQAAALYRKLGSWPRAARMWKLAQLYADANDPTRTAARHLEAQYTYAAFLADHPNQIFFNDSLWSGSQTEVFIEQYRDHRWGMHTPPAQQGLTREEREFFLQRERQVRDEQEERWRAYQLLHAVVEKAGDSELGRRAARKALGCLVRINTERFGRKEEIAAATRRLANWLRQHPA
jgi:hypothetical protein